MAGGDVEIKVWRRGKTKRPRRARAPPPILRNKLFLRLFRCVLRARRRP